MFDADTDFDALIDAELREYRDVRQGRLYLRTVVRASIPPRWLGRTSPHVRMTPKEQDALAIKLWDLKNGFMRSVPPSD